MPYDNSNSGVIFKNDRKEKDTHPDGTGSAQIVCPCCQKTTDYFVYSWNKEGQKGPFRSLRFKAKNKQTTR